ncbi:MAG: hypothetical protein M1308_23290, partial [Actinobacteria bacterium]|nr:hypothetical protein [Actinomycetota bacterium]
MKKNFFKVFFIFVMILSIMLSYSLVGCNTTATDTKAGETTTTETAAEETIAAETTTGEITAAGPAVITLGVGSSQTNWSTDTWVLKKTGEVINAMIEPIPIPADSIPDKRSVMIASQSLPDIMNNPDAGAYRVVMSEGPKGAYFPMDTVLDKMPNVKRWFDKYPESYKELTASDGHIYGIPRVNDFDFFDWGLMIRADLLEGTAMPYDKINTIDDLYTALTIIKDAKGYAPWISRHESGGPQRFLNLVVQIFGTGDNMYYNSKNNNYSFGPLEANYKEMITWLNKCYTNGLLNEDIFTMTDEAWSAATA